MKDKILLVVFDLRHDAYSGYIVSDRKKITEKLIQNKLKKVGIFLAFTLEEAVFKAQEYVLKEGLKSFIFYDFLDPIHLNRYRYDITYFRVKEDKISFILNIKKIYTFDLVAKFKVISTPTSLRVQTIEWNKAVFSRIEYNKMVELIKIYISGFRGQNFIWSV